MKITMGYKLEQFCRAMLTAKLVFYRDVLTKAIKKLREDDVFVSAAALSYYTIFFSPAHVAGHSFYNDSVIWLRVQSWHRLEERY